jgi:cytochrome c556
MRMGKNTWSALAAVLVLGGGLLAVVKTGCASDDDDKKAKEAMDKVVKIAKALEDQKKDDAVKQAGELAKTIEDVEPAMDVMKPRQDGGLGFGAKPGKDPKEDGIEPKVQALAKDELSKEDLAAQAADIAKMGYTIAAVGHVAQAKGMPKDAKKGKPEDWKKWSETLSKEALELADVAKAKGTTPAQLHAAAKKLDATCNKCHDTFK